MGERWGFGPEKQDKGGAGLPAVPPLAECIMEVLLGCLLWVSAFLLGASDSTQRCFSDDNETQPFLSFTQPPAQRVERPEDGLQPLYNFARAFLNAVQPNPFPEAIISKALKNEQQDIPKLVRYEAGYLVCLILAVLYLLFMPVAGGLLVWQHFHTRTTSINSRSSKSSSRCYKDIAVSGCLIVTTLLLLIGVVLAFTANSRTRANMRPSLQHLDTNVRIIEDTLLSIPQKMETIMAQYSIPKSELSKTIHEADHTVGATIVTSFSSDVQKALTDLSSAVTDATGSIDNLQTIETKTSSMQGRHSTLQRELAQLQTRLDNLKKCPTCDVPDSSNLETVADYSLIPSVQDKLDSMLPKNYFDSLVEQVRIIKITLLLELNITQESLMKASGSFPSLQSFSEAVSELRTSVQNFEEPIDYYDYVRWAVAVTFCFVMLMIVLLMVAAVSMGLPVLFNPTVYSIYPDARLERTALKLFQVFMILSCAFSWLFIILVFITLFFGGNAHTLGCRSFTDGQIFTFLDQQEDLFTSLNISQGNQTIHIHPSTSTVYQGCVRGDSMFNSMEMNQIFDLEDFLNSTKYLEGFNETAKNMSVNMNGVKLLSDKGRKGLLDFRNIGLDTYDYDATLLQLSKPVVKRDLAALAKELDDKAELPVSHCTLEKAQGCVLRYLDWVRHSILNEVMGCRWLARSVDNLYTAVCLNVIDPWNAFWLCLGWCCAFLVPGIVLSIYVTRRLRPNPTTPTCIGKNMFILPDIHSEKGQHKDEKLKENHSEKAKSNIYMTLEELHDIQMKGKCDN
ncbi:prominin-2-like [Polymixia lowei]